MVVGARADLDSGSHRYRVFGYCAHCRTVLGLAMQEISIPFERLGITCTSARYLREDSQILGDMVHRLVARFATEKQDPFVYYTPKNWFEHLKATIFPKWLLAKWPAKQTRHEVSVKTVYPFLKTKIPPDIQGPFVTVIFNDTNWCNFLADTEGVDRFEWKKEVTAKLMKEHLADFHKCHFCGRAWFDKP